VPSAEREQIEHHKVAVRRGGDRRLVLVLHVGCALGVVGGCADKAETSGLPVEPWAMRGMRHEGDAAVLAHRHDPRQQKQGKDIATRPKGHKQAGPFCCRRYPRSSL
jgi:hypothetical protein